MACSAAVLIAAPASGQGKTTVSTPATAARRFLKDSHD
jgi:cobyrinic acid a,c-diamide synthase